MSQFISVICMLLFLWSWGWSMSPKNPLLCAYPDQTLRTNHCLILILLDQFQQYLKNHPMIMEVPTSQLALLNSPSFSSPSLDVDFFQGFKGRSSAVKDGLRATDHIDIRNHSKSFFSDTEGQQRPTIKKKKIVRLFFIIFSQVVRRICTWKN